MWNKICEKSMILKMSAALFTFNPLIRIKQYGVICKEVQKP